MTTSTTEGHRGAQRPELLDLTIDDAGARLRGRSLTSEELTATVLARIEATEPALHSFITVTPELALAQARAADQRLAKGEALGPLDGVPIAIKDIINTKGVRTTAGSRILEHFVSPYDATVTRRLRAAGAVCVGKTNCDEFAMGSSNENSAYGGARNPWDTARVPGGSSGGSASAVAARQCLGALGTDTGGSIRQPASHCGVVGLKPTYGRVSRYGVIAYASSLDQVGPMARSVRDCAHLLGAIAGHDALDSTSVPRPVPAYASTLAGGVRGLRVGLPKEYFVEGMSSEVSEAVRGAVRQLEALGATVEEVSLPHTEYAVAAYYLIATAEASSNLARYDGTRYGLRVDRSKGLLDMYQQTRGAGFGTEVKRRIMLGTYALSAGYYDAFYLKGQKVRTLIRRDFEQVFARCQAIVTPTAPTTAFRLGEKVTDPLEMYLSDIFTISVNLAGLPGLSLPCGFDAQGLPIGLQIVGRPFDEETVLRTAYAYEQSTDWHSRSPSI
ncbi:MAG TPA: Asp-tRNA(Asn)/Glu-tRNA(Gln) amidotransferase subunit GatA [Candidatus Dormibacteraeota bacterium]|nr:Asp-tRNA(Asn)/Glu-tRNA(Gln) amidotransferase subunit GatA [Candidatus Dormibacteraeota bacterium]